MWLIGSIITSVIHIVAAIYLITRISNVNDTQLSHLSSGFDRATHLLCKDAWIAIYILVFLFFFGWLCLGTTWIFDSDIPSCIDKTTITTVLALGWSYFCLGPVALTCSLCCTACFNRHNYTNNDDNNNNNNNNITDNNDAKPNTSKDPATFSPAVTGFEVIPKTNSATTTSDSSAGKDDVGTEIPYAAATVIASASTTDHDMKYNKNTNINTDNTNTDSTNDNNNSNTSMNNTIQDATKAINNGLQDTWNMIRNKVQTPQQKDQEKSENVV